MNREFRLAYETDDFVDLQVELIDWVIADGRYVLEKDYRVGGEVWRVHKNDPDPFPSRPHAHCIEGKERYVGCKLHLGTAALYRGREAAGRFLSPKQFVRLIELIR